MGSAGDLLLWWFVDFTKQTAFTQGRALQYYWLREKYFSSIRVKENNIIFLIMYKAHNATNFHSILFLVPLVRVECTYCNTIIFIHIAGFILYTVTENNKTLLQSKVNNYLECIISYSPNDQWKYLIKSKSYYKFTVKLLFLFIRTFH